MTLIYKPSIARVKVDPYTENEDQTDKPGVWKQKNFTNTSISIIPLLISPIILFEF